MTKTATPEAQARREAWEIRQNRTPGFCRRCGRGGIHATHDTADERAVIEYHQTHPDTPFCDFLPGGVEGSATRTDGGVSVDVKIKVHASDMKHWRPETINKFFAGMAMVEDAVRRGRTDALEDHEPVAQP